jgi:hypothetical protein
VSAGAGSPRSPLTLDDLLADLTWPRLLRVGRLALRPARLGLGTFYVAGCGALLALADVIDRDHDRNALWQIAKTTGRHAVELGAALVGLHANEAANRLVDIFLRDPAAAVSGSVWPALIVVPLLLIWTVVMGGAIVRTAATELAWNRTTSWPEALAMALGRWKSLVGAVLLPLVAIWVVALGMAGLGWALFNLPVLRFVGALGWGVFLFGGVVIAVLSLGFVLGHAMLVPGVVCEGADTIDAVQHGYAMGLARPLRLLGYTAILAVQAVVVGMLVAVVIGVASLGAQVAAQAGAGERGDAIIAAARDAGFVLSDAKVGGAASPDLGGRALVKVWTIALTTLGYGAAVSYWWCAATGLFLAMRRACDGQEFSELWTPGMVDGTVAESSQARVGPGGETKAGAAISEAIVDNGPADEG